MANCTNPFRDLPMYGEESSTLVTCEKCFDVHAEWQREEVKSESAGPNAWVDIVCPRCQSPNYKAADLESYAKCAMKLARERGVKLQLADFNAMPYAWCLNTTPNDFLNAVEAVHLNN